MRDREAGAILVITLLVLLLMSALGGGLVLVSSSETLIAANFRDSQEALYAGNAAAELAMADFATQPDVDALLSGAVRSVFSDGSLGGFRERQGVKVDVAEAINLANCHEKTACTDADMDAVSGERPWGPNNPRWQPYVSGWLSDLVPGTVSSFYVLVLIGDDPSESDNAPLRDGQTPGGGADIVALRAEAFGPRSVHKTIDLIIGRAGERGEGKVRIVSWREVR